MFLNTREKNVHTNMFTHTLYIITYEKQCSKIRFVEKALVIKDFSRPCKFRIEVKIK